jgi:hypothetical protein
LVLGRAILRDSDMGARGALVSAPSRAISGGGKYGYSTPRKVGFWEIWVDGGFGSVESILVGYWFHFNSDCCLYNYIEVYS